MPWNTLNQPVVSERFVDAVGDLIAEDVEFLPIDAFIGGWTRKDRWSPVSEIRIDGPADRAFFVLTALRTVRLPVTIYGYPVVQDLRPVVPEGLHLFRNEVFRVALLCRHTIRERCEERGVTGVQYHPLWESGETTWRDQS